MILSTVKNYNVSFGQKHRGNSLLEVALVVGSIGGVCLIFTIMPEDVDAKKVDATTVAEIVDVFIFLLPRAVSNADSLLQTLFLHRIDGQTLTYS